MGAAAELFSVGLDGAVMWRSDDPVEAMFLFAAAERLQELRAREREDQAVRIINNLAKAMKG